MATYTLWSGTRSCVGNYEYETVEVEGEEIGAVTFADEDAIISYRAFETADGAVFIHYVARQRYEATGDIDVYDSIEDAAKEYGFVLKKAGVI